MSRIKEFISSILVEILLIPMVLLCIAIGYVLEKLEE